MSTVLVQEVQALDVGGRGGSITLKTLEESSKADLAATRGSDQLLEPLKRNSNAKDQPQKSRCWEDAVKVGSQQDLDDYYVALLMQIYNSTLTKDDKKRINIGKLEGHPMTDLVSMLETARQAKSLSDARRSDFQQKAESFMTVFNRYAACVDVMIQQSPETTAIVWGSIRFLMGVRLIDFIHYIMNADLFSARSL